MKRVVVLLVLLLAGAVAGAVAQQSLKTEDPASIEVVQLGVLYKGSVCSGEDRTPTYTEFYFRPVRTLASGWIETEYSSTSLDRINGRYEFRPWPKPVRLNLQRMCSVRVAEPIE